MTVLFSKCKQMSVKNILHFGSIACVVHCIITPLFVHYVPFIAGYVENQWIEILFFVFSMLCGLGIVISGFCRHKKANVLLLFAIGIMFWVSHLIHEFFIHDHGNHEGYGNEYLILIFGTVFIFISYYVNHRYIKCCSKSCCEGE